MKLNETQKQQVAAWLADGVKIGDLQTRLAKEFGLHLTYMDVRFLVDDLKLMPKDPEPAAPAPPPPAAPPAVAAPAPEAQAAPAVAPPKAMPAPPVGTGKVSLQVDALTRPGAMVSGKVTFSDGQTAEWYLDQMGRLGLAAVQKGYRPPEADVETFQIELQRELQKLGM